MNMTRRHFLGSLGVAWGASAFAGRHEPLGWLKRKRGSRDYTALARNLILVRMDGGPSHLDTFDLKTGAWTPDHMGPELLGGHLLWPTGHMPKLAKRWQQLAIVRGMTALEPVHDRSAFHLVSGYVETNATVRRAPHFASVLSHLLGDPEQPTVLPISVSFVPRTVGNGLLPLQHKLAQMDINHGYPNLLHPLADPVDRFALLDDQKGVRETDPRHFFRKAQAQAEQMSATPGLEMLSDFSSMPQPYSPNEDRYLRQAHLAARVLGLDLGVRFVELSFDEWDHHYNIYQEGNGIQRVSGAFDIGMDYLLSQLEATAGHEDGKTLLDETLVVAVGEFGRTPGALDTLDGRDHYPFACPALLAGAGIGGGRVIGSTDPNGAYVADPGWSHGRPMHLSDLVATFYRALGIDPSAELVLNEDETFPLLDPSLGDSHPINEVFEEV